LSIAFMVAWRSAMHVGLSSTHFRPAPGVVTVTPLPLQAAKMAVQHKRTPRMTRARP
jgi:hypothetical protein